MKHCIEEDAEGKYVIPGLIDGHIHIESSMVTPAEFSRYYSHTVLQPLLQTRMR